MKRRRHASPHPTCASAPHRVRLAFACALAGTLLLGGAASLEAQAPPQVTGPPDSELRPPPEGSASLHGRIVHPSLSDAGAGLPVALYALRSDGTPGLAGSTSDGEGRFRFDGISSEPGIVYLVGTRYRDVPFGNRASFEPGQELIEVEIPLSELTDDASALAVVETMVRLEWLGSQLVIDEAHHLRNPGSAVISVATERRAGREPVFRARLPAGTVEFMDGQQGLGGGGLERRGDELLHWGPVYPGAQEIRYRYIVEAPVGLPADASSPADPPPPFALDLSFPSGTGRVIVLRTEGAGEVSGPALVPADEPMEVEGVRYVRLDAGPIEAGDSLELSVTAPETRSDPEALRISRADVWVDMDDTAMRVSVELELRVSGAAPLRAGAGEALFHASLPEGAEFLDLSGAARALGVAPDDRGGLLVRGPVPPGQSTLGYRFQAPVLPGGARLDLGFERPVSLLNVMVADVGVVIESDRLHRRRPFRQGTRLYLHRQAYQVAAQEQVPVRFTAIERRRITPAMAVAGGLLGALLGASFLAAPLRSRVGAGRREKQVESPLSFERQSLYDSIRDLDHDHETGKLEEADYLRMKEELRREAIELLRHERERNAASDAGSETPPSAERCPGCGGAILHDWRFCSHCGHGLGPAPREAG